MTGAELCRLLQISYHSILQDREADASDNRNYFVETLIKIPFVKSKLADERKKLIDEQEFYDTSDDT